MPRQNRVAPSGEILATPERGTLMGNRGVLHNEEGRIVRPWQLKRWISCVLEFRGRHREVMTPGRYTELFFLDEPTALAAGHRPCAECRHARFVAFREAWRAGNALGGAVKADEMDERLHAERVGSARSKRTFEAKLGELPDGVFVREAGRPWLIWGGRFLAWSPGGYREARPRPRGGRVVVLTPPSIVAAIRAGYVPEGQPQLISR